MSEHTTRTHHIPGISLTDHYFSVPLDHSHPERDKIEVFTREVIAAGKQQANLL